MTTFIEAHVLQSVPYSCLNRGEDNRPKTLSFGGVQRIQVSSPSWKRATRLYAEDLMRRNGQDVDETIRTIHHGEYLATILREERGMAADRAEQAAKVAMRFPGKAFPKDKTDSGAADGRAPIFVTDSQFHDVADLVEKNIDAFLAEDPYAKEKPTGPFKEHRTKITELLCERRGLVPLLGRFVAEIPGAKVDSAITVPAAFTTHAQSVMDEFVVAVNEKPRDRFNPGAAAIVDASFASGTFYRYTSINLDVLTKNLLGSEQDARDLAVLTLRAFVESMPSAKQAVSGQMSPVDFVHVVTRSNPENYCNAFESPVRARDGYLVPSVRALGDYIDRKNQIIGGLPDFAAYSSLVKADDLPFGEALSRDLLYANLRNAL